MPEPIAEFADYNGMLAGIRKRIAELGMPVELLDEISGLPKGYFSKIAGSRPIKRISHKSMGDIFGALAVRCHFVEDTEQLARIKGSSKYRVRDISFVRSSAVHRDTTRRFMSKIGRKGGTNSRKNLGKRKTKQLARMAANARWHKPKVTEIKGAKARAIRAQSDQRRPQ